MLRDIEGDVAETENVPEVKVEPKLEAPVDVVVKTPPKPDVPEVEQEVEEALDEGLY